MRSPQRIVLFFDNFGPYHLARLRGAQRVLGTGSVVGLQVHARSAEYAWEVPAGNIKQGSLETVLQQTRHLSAFARARAVWKKLNHLNPTVIAIAGYSAVEMLTALGWCWWRKRISILFSDSKEDDSPRSSWKEILKGFIARRYRAAIVGGHPHIRYLTKLGFPREAIFTSMAAVGNEDYHPLRIQGVANPLSTSYFLTINRFIFKKNLPFVLDCFAEYRRRLKREARGAWDLVLAGDGPLRDELIARMKTLGLEGVVHFPGFLQQTALLPYLHHCEVFIHASLTEQWGLVVNEAMAAGRPVFVSRACGCFEDLIVEGKTGLGFDPKRPEELTALMLQATKNELPLAALGTAALEHIKTFSPISFGRTLGLAVDYGIERAKARLW